MIDGFKKFIAQGNSVDLAVGVVIGAAFGTVITAIVNGIINPIIAGIVGQQSFNDVLAFSLGDAKVRPGLAITAVVNFLLIAAAVYFVVIVPMNVLNSRRKVDDGPQELSAEDKMIALLERIADK